jgi:hypothetical protein
MGRCAHPAGRFGAWSTRTFDSHELPREAMSSEPRAWLLEREKGGLWCGCAVADLARATLRVCVHLNLTAHPMRLKPVEVWSFSARLHCQRDHLSKEPHQPNPRSLNRFGLNQCGTKSISSEGSTPV